MRAFAFAVLESAASSQEPGMHGYYYIPGGGISLIWSFREFESPGCRIENGEDLFRYRSLRGFATWVCW